MQAARTGTLLLIGGLLACSPGQDELEAEALSLHRSAIVVDTHSDTTPLFEDPNWRFDRRHALGHMDLPRMREGGLDVQFWSIYLGKTEGPGRAIRKALKRIDAVYRMLERHPDQLALAQDVAGIRRIVGEGKIASLMGLEGGHIIEDSLPALRGFYRRGVRYMTLTHSFHTSWADSSGTDTTLAPVHLGLTRFGKQVVHAMNELGMMVDVSHVSDQTLVDVLRASRAPMIASHSSCRALANHPRNLPDPMLRAIASKGGVIMLNFYPAYIDQDANEATRAHKLELRDDLIALRSRFKLEPAKGARAIQVFYAQHPYPSVPLDILLDHFDHAIRVAGPDHVGIGADWDGVPSMPVGMEDVSRLPALTLGLLRRGHSAETVRKVLGENLLRVMSEVEYVARELGYSER